MSQAYSLQFEVPNHMWMTTIDGETPEARRKRRGALRHRVGDRVWAAAHAQGLFRVDRFALLVAIAGRPESPVLAAETLKPLIDAGTDAGAWADDDPGHRVATGYMRDRRTVRDGFSRITLFVVPLEPDEKPPECIEGLAPGARGALVNLTISDRDWLTSNMREPAAVRAARQTRVMRRAAPLWRRTALGSDCAAICGVRYPDPGYPGEPDKTAETATAMWGAGVAARAVPGEPSCFWFYIMDKGRPSAPKTHDMSILAFTTPKNFNWAEALTDGLGAGRQSAA